MITVLTSWLVLFAEDPITRSLQTALVCLAGVHIYVVLYVLRDAWLRISRVSGQILSLCLVGLLPGVGFLVYLLVRPAHTKFERRLLFLLEHSVVHKHIRRHTAHKLKQVRTSMETKVASK
jgi:hypothetical protein